MPDDEDSFEAQFVPLFRSAYRVAYAILGDRSDAEDVAQEALARGLVRWDRLAGFEEPWLIRVTGNLAIDRVRASRRRRAADLLAVGGADAVVERVDLQRALLRLSKRQREVVTLRFIAGFSEPEVAALLGCTVGTVKQHSSRAFAALRGLLREEDTRVRPAG